MENDRIVGIVVAESQRGSSVSVDQRAMRRVATFYDIEALLFPLKFSRFFFGQVLRNRSVRSRELQAPKFVVFLFWA